MVPCSEFDKFKTGGVRKKEIIVHAVEQQREDNAAPSGSTMAGSTTGRCLGNPDGEAVSLSPS